jgi:hypothetical protein
LGKKAEVLAVQLEPEFGCMRVVDVRQCSLIPGRMLSCEKTCLARL